MHMPGHKRNQALFGDLTRLGADYDITEIDGFDNLHGSEGILKDAMERAAKLWNSKASYFLVNGSTCGILAGIRAATQYGDRILVARNCHKSIYHTIELCGLNPVFLVPPMDESFGINASLPPSAVAEAFEQYPDIRLVVLVSPSYEGVISDVKAICAVAHAKGIPVLVDEAHGAHLGFSPYFSGGAIEGGADLVIQSLHKTLPSLTQTAIGHCNSTLVSEREFARQLSIFETSSPSYLLMASIDACVHLMEQEGEALFRSWQQNLEGFHERMKSLSKLQVLCNGQDSLKQHPLMAEFDPGKLVISARGISMTGSALMDTLRRDYHIELEMAAGDYAVAMTGLGTTEKHVNALADALLDLDGRCTLSPEQKGRWNLPPVPERVCSIAAALEEKAVAIPVSRASGRVCREYLWAYPPGIPLIIPGERVSEEFLAATLNLERNGISLKSSGGKWPLRLDVLPDAESAGL
jgi:arginine decarboxylase